jgi:hypothetical protein
VSETSNHQGRRRAIDGDEQDVFSKWRSMFCYTQRPGVTSAIKRKARRRERQEGKQLSRNAHHDSP